MKDLPPLHERSFEARCRIAHALTGPDQRPAEEVAELLHVQFYDVPDLAKKGAEMLRFMPEPKAERAVRSTPEPRVARDWTPAEKRMLETNRQKFRAQVLKRMEGGE